MRERAVELAAARVSVRHRVKSDVVLAAALCSAGRVDESRALADDGLNATERYGLIPLRWALASLLAGIGSDSLPGSRGGGDSRRRRRNRRTGGADTGTAVDDRRARAVVIV